MRVLILTLLGFGLSGCLAEAPNHGPTDDALARLATIVEQDTIEIRVPPRVPFEAHIAPFSDTRISLTEALSLGECNAVPLIAERNSSLGRHKSASTRFLYEWRIQDRLKACQQGADRPWLTTALDQKSADLDHAILHVLLTGEEAADTRSSLPSGFSSLREAGAAYGLAFAEIRPWMLAALRRQSPPAMSETASFEQALQRWGQTHYHAELGRAVRETHGWLIAANQLLLAARTANRLCPMGQATPKGRRLQGFVQGYFKDRLQPTLGTISQAVRTFEQQWAPLHAESATLSHAAPIERMLMLSPGQLPLFHGALEAHIEHWQALLEQCQLSPRAATTNS